MIGAGAAGCAAAIEARRAGAEVLILDKEPAGREGGNARVGGGVWFVNNDTDRVATYLRNLCGGFPVPDEVIDVWSEETALNTEWIEGLGMRVKVAPANPPGPDYPELDGSECVGDRVGVEGVLGGGLLREGLIAAVRDLDIPVLLATRAMSLVQDPGSEAILGVRCESGEDRFDIGARRSVVIAAGGFQANPQMVRDYLGVAGTASAWGSPSATGDGIRMAMKAGADLWHMDNMQGVPGLAAPGFPSGFPVYPERHGYIFVAPDGSRFIDETVKRGHGQVRLNGVYELFPRGPMHFVFDEAQRISGPLSPTYEEMLIGYNLVVEGYHWSADNSAEVERGWIMRANTIGELAAQLGLPAAELQATVDRYNSACARGTDEDFGRPAGMLVPLITPPYYGFAWGPVLHSTSGGPRRNERAEVIDVFGEVIPRLYAAGDVSSTYSWGKDSGFHIADAFAFGRVAGRQAAAMRPQTNVGQDLNINPSLRELA